MTLSVTWHGHATLSLKVGEKEILVDPFFTGNPVAKKNEIGAQGRATQRTPPGNAAFFRGHNWKGP